MGEKVKLLVRYVKNLGLLTGLPLFFKVEILKMTEFAMPNYQGFIYLRPFSSDLKVFREIFLFGSYAITLPSVPAVIVDAGSNIGLSSIFLAKRFCSATIYSIEPELSNFELLKKNVANYDNIKVFRSALWHRDCCLRITDMTENHWAFTVEECDQGSPGSFKAMSISSFMIQNGIERIDLLKMDIEGAEREVFSADCGYWLARTRTIIIELHDWLKSGCSAAFFRSIARYRIKTMVHEGMLLIELNE